MQTSSTPFTSAEYQQFLQTLEQLSLREDAERRNLIAIRAEMAAVRQQLISHRLFTADLEAGFYDCDC